MKKTIETFDYIVFVFILVFSLLIGLYSGLRLKVKQLVKKLSNNKIENIELNDTSNEQTEVSDYLTANSSIGTFPIAFSLLATFYSATALLGMPAEVYVYGIQYWVMVFGQVLTPIIGALITGPFFAKLHVISVFEYLEMRFNSKLVRQLGMFYYVLRNFISSSIFMYGPATTFSALANLNEKLSIGLIGFIATLYTSIGGIRSVIWTDLFQALIMFLSLIIIVSKGLYDIGGFSNLWSTNLDGGRLNFFDFNPDPFVRQSFWSLFFGMIVYMSISYCFDQQMIQRFQASKSRKNAQKALLLNAPGIFIIVTLCCLVGLILYAIYSKCDPLTNPIDRISNPNQLVGYYVINNFGSLPGFAGLFLGAIFSASLSSVSSCLNSQSAIIWQDFLKHLSYFSSFNDSKSLKTNKIIVLVCGCLSTGLAFLISTLGGNLTQISSSLNGAFNAPLIGLFLLGLLFSISTPIGVICGTVVGFVTSLWVSIGAYVVKPIYPKLNVSIELCSVNITENYFINNNKVVNVTGFDKFYYMSYMWYTTFGTLVTVIIGLIVSLINKGFKNRVDKNFILFDLTKFLNKK